MVTAARRRLLRSVFALGFTLSVPALAGCGSDAPPPTAENCNVYTWEPGLGDMSSFPTADILTPDDERPTGFRVQLPDNFDVAQYGPVGPPFREYLTNLDGVGVQGEMWLGFSGTFDAALLPIADGAVRATDGLGIVVLPQNEPPFLVPVETRVGVDGTGASTNVVYVRPVRPLPEATRVALFATRALTAAAGGCFEPLDAMRELLRTPDEDRRSAIEALTELGAVGSSRDVVALHVVTTQSITRESFAIAEHIETLSPTLTDASCTDETTHRRCTAMLMVEDYRGDDGVVRVDVDNVVPDKTWALPVAIWLPPASMVGPYPTIVFGHGLGSSRNQAGEIAPEFAGFGWVTVAIDAVAHGDHPSTGGQSSSQMQAVLRFFALDLAGPSVNGLRLRDHFRQSTYDKLQLTRALTAVGDLDGDNIRDVDSSRLAQVGVSLGGIMSTELAALSDSYSAVVNLVGGGVYTRLVADPDASFASLLDLVLTQQSLDQRAQAMSVLQMTLDRGDGAAYAQHVLSNRFRSASAVPDYFFGVALDDDVVPNSASYALARALGVPLVGPVLRPAFGVPVSNEPLPLSGNGSDGSTVGLLQFDVLDADGTVATHEDTPRSALGREAVGSFLSSHFEDGTATLTDPYFELGIAHASSAP